MYRHGDVLINPIKEIPKKLKRVPRDNGRVILAYGEVTGHAHAICAPEKSVTLFQHPDGGTYLRVVGAPAELTHEEHATITLPPGYYRIGHQREYFPEEIRRVVD